MATHSLFLIPAAAGRPGPAALHRRSEDDWIACLQIAAQHLASEIGRPAQLNLNGHRLSLAEDVDHPLTIYNPDRPVWNEEGILDLVGDDIHGGRQALFDRLFCIAQFDRHLEAHHALFRHPYQIDLRDLAVVLPAEDGVEGQVRPRAEPDLIDVDLRDLHIDQHPR